MFGRPVGFDLRMGVGFGDYWGAGNYLGVQYHATGLYGVEVQEPVALRIVFNSCNCPASSFIGT